MLHLINRSPSESDSLETCLRFATPGSAILLYENCVYAALHDTTFSARVQESTASIHWYALEPDLTARGIETGRIITGIQLVDYRGFVQLVTEYKPVQSWT
jgi:tRNA 2-thiouridine synthesizing protein B